MRQGQFSQFRKQQSKIAEYNISNFPVFKSLDPTEISDWKVDWKNKCQQVVQSLGREEAHLWGCFSREATEESNQFDADTDHRQAILDSLDELDKDDQNTRQRQILSRLSGDVIFRNHGSIVSNMSHSFVKAGLLAIA